MVWLVNLTGFITGAVEADRRAVADQLVFTRTLYVDQRLQRLRQRHAGQHQTCSDRCGLYRRLLALSGMSIGNRGWLNSRVNSQSGGVGVDNAPRVRHRRYGRRRSAGGNLSCRSGCRLAHKASLKRMYSSPRLRVSHFSPRISEMPLSCTAWTETVISRAGLFCSGSGAQSKSAEVGVDGAGKLIFSVGQKCRRADIDGAAFCRSLVFACLLAWIGPSLGSPSGYRPRGKPVRSAVSDQLYASFKHAPDAQSAGGGAGFR